MRHRLIIALLCAATTIHAQTSTYKEPVDTSCIQVVKCDSLDWYRAERKKYKDLYTLDHMRVAQGRYYLKIITKKPTQRKYLLGWMRRALE